MINVILSSLLSICEITQSKLETKFNYKMWVYDGIRVIVVAGNGQCKPEWITIVMLHSFTHPATSLFVQTSCTWSTMLNIHMVGYGYRGEGTGYVKVRKLDYINEKLVCGSAYWKLPAGNVDIWQRKVVNHSENIRFNQSKIETLHRFWMQLSIHTNNSLALNNDYMIICTKM